MAVPSLMLPGAHNSQVNPLLERVASSPQRPLRSRPPAHTRLAHGAVGHASPMPPSAVKYSSAVLLVHGVQKPGVVKKQPVRYCPTLHGGSSMQALVGQSLVRLAWPMK